MNVIGLFLSNPPSRRKALLVAETTKLFSKLGYNEPSLG